MPESQSDTEHATVQIWSGSTRESYDDICTGDLDEYTLEIAGENTYFVPHEDHLMLAENVENHQKYAFSVDTDTPVELIVETNDSHHEPIEGFNQGNPIERGLRFAPDYDAEPFKTEIWGRIRVRVEKADT